MRRKVWCITTSSGDLSFHSSEEEVLHWVEKYKIMNRTGIRVFREVKM